MSCLFVCFLQHNCPLCSTPFYITVCFREVQIEVFNVVVKIAVP